MSGAAGSACCFSPVSSAAGERRAGGSSTACSCSVSGRIQRAACFSPHGWRLGRESGCDALRGCAGSSGGVCPEWDLDIEKGRGFR